jgi:hypothetical protein
MGPNARTETADLVFDALAAVVDRQAVPVAG